MIEDLDSKLNPKRSELPIVIPEQQFGDRSIPFSKIQIKVNEGVPTGGQSGDMVLDTTNSRIYFKIGDTWKYASLT